MYKQEDVVRIPMRHLSTQITAHKKLTGIGQKHGALAHTKQQVIMGPKNNRKPTVESI